MTISRKFGGRWDPRFFRALIQQRRLWREMLHPAEHKRRNANERWLNSFSDRIVNHEVERGLSAESPPQPDGSRKDLSSGTKEGVGKVGVAAHHLLMTEADDGASARVGVDGLETNHNGHGRVAQCVVWFRFVLQTDFGRTKLNAVERI